MKDIIKIVNSLKNAILLTKSVTQRSGFPGVLLETLS